MAAVYLEFEVTITHSEVGGPRASGSSELSGGTVGCKFRGRIYERQRLAPVTGIGLAHARICYRSVNQ